MNETKHTGIGTKRTVKTVRKCIVSNIGTVLRVQYAGDGFWLILSVRSEITGRFSSTRPMSLFIREEDFEVVKPTKQ